MEKEDLIKKLETIEVPEIEVRSHRGRLKMALLTFHNFGEKDLSSNPMRRMTMFKKFKKFVPIGVVALVTLLVVGVMLIGKQPHSTAYAREMVNNAMETLRGKSSVPIADPTTGTVTWKEPDSEGNIRNEQGHIIFSTDSEGKLVYVSGGEVIEYTFTVDSFLASLQEAEQAKDLTYLGNKVIASGQKIKILKFTDEKENTNILGIDKDNMPVVRFAYSKDGGGGVSSGVMQGTSSITDPDNPGIGGEKTGDDTVLIDLEHQINYWTENLEKP